MNPVYVVVIDNRFVETEVELYAKKDDAIDRARELVNTLGRPVIEGLTKGMVSFGWVYHCRYSEEGDAVWVVETKVAA